MSKTNKSNNYRYGRSERKHIGNMIEGLKEAKDYQAVFDILNSDPKKIWTINSNGVHIDLAIVADNTLEKIVQYIQKINNEKNQIINLDTDIIVDNNEVTQKRVYKLSNYEQNIMKQRKLKKVINNEEEYEEFQFNNAQKKNISKTDSKSDSKSESKIQSKTVSKPLLKPQLKTQLKPQSGTQSKPAKKSASKTVKKTPVKTVKKSAVKTPVKTVSKTNNKPIKKSGSKISPKKKQSTTKNVSNKSA